MSWVLFATWSLEQQDLFNLLDPLKRFWPAVFKLGQLSCNHRGNTVDFLIEQILKNEKRIMWSSVYKWMESLPSLFSFSLHIFFHAKCSSGFTFYLLVWCVLSVWIDSLHLWEQTSRYSSSSPLFSSMHYYNPITRACFTFFSLSSCSMAVSSCHVKVNCNWDTLKRHQPSRCHTSTDHISFTHSLYI